MTSAVEHRFGPYGGQYVPETLMPALAELEDAWQSARQDPAFRSELAEPVEVDLARRGHEHIAR